MPRDGSLWLADDDGRSIHEIDATTGILKRRIRDSQLAVAPRLGGGATAGTSRTDDVQALAYDEARDTLYVFSGTCCMAGLLPTAFRLTRPGARCSSTPSSRCPRQWQKVTVTLASRSPGRSKLDYSAVVGRGVRGSSFGSTSSG